MEESISMIFLGILQGFGAYYAFMADGVWSKLTGLLFCLTCVGCLACSLVFYKDYIINKEKGNQK